MPASEGSAVADLIAKGIFRIRVMGRAPGIARPVYGEINAGIVRSMAGSPRYLSPLTNCLICLVNARIAPGGCTLLKSGVNRMNGLAADAMRP